MRGLLIAEKPSVMREVESVYKNEASSLPFSLEFAAFHGHLMQLCAPEDYDSTWTDWKILPIIPDSFRYKAADLKSVNILAEKIRKGNYDFLVNACDSGREGEHIFWSFYETLGFTHPVKRFWASSVTTPSLKKALHDLRDAKDYDGMRQAAKYRAQLDWLVGMNFTRAATNRKGELTSIGRVQTPTLKLIVDRELQIRNFRPEDFFELAGTFKVNGLEFNAVHLIAPDHKDSRFSSQGGASKIAADVKRKAPGVIAGEKTEVKSTPAPTLYSLTELQKAASRQLKFKADRTLSVAQKLYEDGLLTYPRTESRFLPTDMIPEIPAHISPLTAVPELASFAASIQQPEIDRMLKGKYVDDAGITDHHAIIPTDKTPNWSSLSKEEQALYTLVGKSFLAIFMPPHQAAASTIIVNVGGHLFKASGNVTIDQGYRILYPSKKGSGTASLPACKKGDKADLIKTNITKGTTKPPARYTIDTILAAMTNVGQTLSDSVMRSILREATGIGTPATRAEILSKLEERQYVKYEKNTYYALDKGIHLIDVVGDRTFCSAALTAKWEEKLIGLEKGTYHKNFRQEMDQYIKDETSYLLTNIESTIGAVVGKCPYCGGNVVDYGRVYVCENRKKDDPSSCQVRIPKVIAGYTITQEDITAILSEQPTEMHEFSNQGKSWSAALQLNKEKGLVFTSNVNPPVGTCPLCGGRVFDRGKVYLCEHRDKDNPESCKTMIPKVVAGYTLTDEDLQNLLTEKATKSIKFSYKGKNWEASLIFDKEKGVIFASKQATQIGTCPFCGGRVMEYGSAYACENWKKNDTSSCKVVISKVTSGCSITREDMNLLLAGKATGVKHFSAKGKTWDTAFILDREKGARFIRRTVGKCPICGGNVIEMQKAFICENHKEGVPNPCTVWFPKIVGGSKLSEEDVQILLQRKKTSPRIIKTKTNADWTVTIFINEDGEFRVEDATKKETVGSCPVCGKPVYAADNRFYCSAGQNLCKWSFPRVIKGARIENTDMANMLKGGKSNPKTFTWASGKKGKASIYLEDGDLRWEFDK